MIEISHRSVSESDLKSMKAGRGTLVRNVLMVTLPISLVLVLIVYLVTRSVIAASVISGAFFVGSTVSNLRFFRRLQTRAALVNDQRAIEVIEVEAGKVFDIEHPGSHGPAYCFFATDGQALLLVGQWLREVHRFPSLSFRVLRWSDNGEPIRIEVKGGKIKPEHSTVRLKEEYSNGDIELFDATPETLQSDLDRAFGAALPQKWIKPQKST